MKKSDRKFSVGSSLGDILKLFEEQREINISPNELPTENFLSDFFIGNNIN
jgi:hypothetical protein